jgi:hypothetical protein
VRACDVFAGRLCAAAESIVPHRQKNSKFIGTLRPPPSASPQGDQNVPGTVVSQGNACFITGEQAKVKPAAVVVRGVNIGSWHL